MCPPPEQDALASAREPLLESEPTSPLSPLSIAPAEAPEDGATSPLSPLRTNPAEAPEDGLFRTTTITHLLEGCGGVFADKCEYDDDAEGADRLYARSSPPRGDEEVAFVSHAWQDSAYLKWLALCYRSNLVVAVVASTIAWVARRMAGVRRAWNRGVGRGRLLLPRHSAHRPRLARRLLGLLVLGLTCLDLCPL